jgi:MFS family permease
MFLAFSFTELGAIPDAWRTWIVVVAAFGTAFGSSFGSVGSSVVIYAKAFEKRVELLDWISLALSILATMGGFILGFAALLAGEEWAAFVRIWGPIALSILVGGDAAGDLIELGGPHRTICDTRHGRQRRKPGWNLAECSPSEPSGNRPNSCSIRPGRRC